MHDHPLLLASDRSGPSTEIAVDAVAIAEGLGLPVAEFRTLMDRRKISTLCERGIGEDAGRYRATFYYGERRLRLVVDGSGRILATG